jgi:DNA-binding GntR family transcriptional regulator
VAKTFRRPPTAQEAVLTELRGWIATGRLQPGEQIVQDTLALELGVSRVPLREALKILEAEGQVSYVAHRGYFVTELSLSDMVEVYRIRELLEAEAVRRAVPLMTTEDVDRLEEAADDVRRAAEGLDVPGMSTTNRRFHFGLISACAMPRLIRILHVLWDSTEVYRSVYFTDDTNKDRVLDEHDELVAAVKSGDVEGALDVLSRHRQNAIAALRPLLEQSGVDWRSPHLFDDLAQLEALD